MSIYLSNAFSIQMLPINRGHLNVNFREVTLEEAREELSQGFTSAVGHQDTAAVLSSMLGLDVPFNRVSISLNEGDTLIVAQVVGGRLPEGCTQLPEGVTIKFFRVWF